MQNNDTRPLFVTIHKSKLKMDQNPKCEIRNNKIYKRKQVLHLWTFILERGYYEFDLKDKGNKSKNK